MTSTEAEAFNRGVAAVLTIAATSAARITAIGKRPIAEGFAIAALAELCDAGRALLLPEPRTNSLVRSHCERTENGSAEALSPISQP